ncbi:uncharacterized protein LOC127858603 [Dreissena polymorpha]|uniref:Uncharacterized protein n=1 Tax=Dreissena polymorpha TaxID=45954 RepID=A0A9D3Z434_DREPO|nr:uncharacterized protein LOC127858603 [Dreissena polymorpha]KAH3712515.1 hypothetical protein DPMN_072266 [Dreissena polymorpha]
MSIGFSHAEVLLNLLLSTSWIAEYTCHVGNCSCTSDSAGSLQLGCINVNCTSSDNGNGYLLAFTDLLQHGNVSNGGIIDKTEESLQFVSTVLDLTSGTTSWNTGMPNSIHTCAQANAFTSMAYDCISGPCKQICNDDTISGVNHACVWTADYPQVSTIKHRECTCQFSTTSNYLQVKMHDNKLTSDQTLELISADNVVVYQWNRTTPKGRALLIGETLNISADHSITLRWKNPTLQNESFFIGFYAYNDTISLNCFQPESITTSISSTETTHITTRTSLSVSETLKTEQPSSAQSSSVSETYSAIDVVITDPITTSRSTDISTATPASVRTKTENNVNGTIRQTVDSTPFITSDKTSIEISTEDIIATSNEHVQSNTKGFPIWIIFLILGILLIVAIIVYIVYRKKKKANQVNPDPEQAHENNEKHWNEESPKASGVASFIPSTSGFWNSSKTQVESNTPARNKFKADTARNVGNNDGLLSSESSRKKKKKKKKKRHTDLEQEEHNVDNHKEDAVTEPEAETNEKPKKKRKKRKKRHLEEDLNGENIGNQTEHFKVGTLGGVDYDHLL